MSPVPIEHLPKTRRIAKLVAMLNYSGPSGNHRPWYFMGTQEIFDADVTPFSSVSALGSGSVGFGEEHLFL